MAGLRVNLIHGSPEAHGTIANGRLGRIHPSAFTQEHGWIECTHCDAKLVHKEFKDKV